MKKIILSVLLLTSASCFADVLHNFNDIKSAILNGKKIHFVVDFGKCGGSNNSPSSHFNIAAYTPNEIGVTDDHIAASFTHFTFDNLAFPEKPVNEFVRYTITSDNNMTIKSQTLSAVTYEPLQPPFAMTCKIDNGVSIYAVENH